VAMLIEIGRLYDRLEAWPEALEAYEGALSLLHEVDDPLVEASVHQNAGMTCCRAGHHSRALRYLGDALAIWQQSHDHEAQARTLAAIGTVHHELNQWHEALSHLESALAIHHELGNRQEEARLLNHLGVIKRERGEAQEALALFHRGLSLQQALGDLTGEAASRYNIALLYHAQGSVAAAVQELRRVLELDELLCSPALQDHRAFLAQVESGPGGKKRRPARAWFFQMPGRRR
jgi:tetratricopeptide (TPR) repeat protein